MWTSKSLAVVLLLLGTVVTIAPTASAQEATCAGRPVTVNIALGERPTSGPDVILGTPGDDVINGLGGRDVICGLGGNDRFDGGPASDEVFDGGLIYSPPMR